MQRRYTIYLWTVLNDYGYNIIIANRVSTLPHEKLYDYIIISKLLIHIKICEGGENASMILYIRKCQLSVWVTIIGYYVQTHFIKNKLIIFIIYIKI